MVRPHGFEPRFPANQAGVFPLDEGRIGGTPGDRTQPNRLKAERSAIGANVPCVERLTIAPAFLYVVSVTEELALDHLRPEAIVRRGGHSRERSHFV